MKKKTMVRTGFCKRCGACCNVNNLQHIRGRIKPHIKFLEDGYCEHVDRETKLCRLGVPDDCKRFPASPIDNAGIPQCGYRWVRYRVDRPRLEEGVSRGGKRR